MKKIELQNVTKKIGSKCIVDGVTENIHSGEVFGLLGPNGAGKTTIIKMITGLMKVTDGKILIEGKDIERDFCRAVSRVRALIEQPAVYPYLSGYDNMRIFASMDRVTEERIQEVIEIIGLSNDIHRKVREYSLGMRQRLGIGIALLSRPGVLILDEPANGLDPEGIMELRVYLRQIAKQEDVAVIVSSHILSEMSQLCQRFAIMKKGRLIKVISKDEFQFADDVCGYFIELDENLRAFRLLESLYDVEIKEKGILVTAKREKIPDINTKLVENGIKVYSIAMRENPLEKYYFEAINGKDEGGLYD